MTALTLVESGLIPVYTNENEDRVINARELHEFLEVGKDFSNWIKDRIKKYGFTEGVDFTPILAESTGGRPSNEYILTLDTAKEIAMVQNNERGREIRKYFIEVEKRYQQQLFGELEEIKAADKNLIIAEQTATLVKVETNISISRVTEYTKAYGIAKTEASVIVHKAKMEGTDPDIVVHEILEARRAKELTTKRNRIYVRIQSLGSVYKELYPDLEEDPYEHAWHTLADELRMDLGHTVNWKLRHDRDKAATEAFNANRAKGISKKKSPGYLDYIDQDGCHQEAEKAVTRLLKKYQKKLDAVRLKREESKIVDDVRAL